MKRYGLDKGSEKSSEKEKYEPEGDIECVSDTGRHLKIYDPRKEKRQKGME